MYFPTPEVNLALEKEVVFDVNNVKLYGWVLNEGNEKALIYYGGNAESIEANIAFFKTELNDYTVYLVNYRGYGKSEGKPFQKALFLDALAIYDSVKKKHNSISIMGRSLGSGIATFVASQKQVDRLVLITPYDSIENIVKSIYKIFPVSMMLKDKYNSMKNIEHINAKTLIVYGLADNIIPALHTRNLITYFKNKSLQVVPIEKASHNDISLFHEYRTSIKTFLN